LERAIIIVSAVYIYLTGVVGPFYNDLPFGIIITL
jgi:hypothetical protein